MAAPAILADSMTAAAIGLVLLLTLAVIVAVLLRRAWRGLRCRRMAGLLRAQRGSATIEFALVFPIVLGLVLILLQTTLVMAGQLFVHYAAYAATRSAIVYIPSDATSAAGGFGQARNEIVPVAGDPKFDAIRGAAAVALMPVSGELAGQTFDDDPIDPEAVTEALVHYFESGGYAVPNWVQAKVADRLRYALMNTTVTLMRTETLGSEVMFTPMDGAVVYAFGPREPITVRIEHRLNLSIPYARAAFADGAHEQGGAYTRVVAQSTLTNEGIDPELPEEPDLPRSDQLDEEDEQE